ncbi:unnamed protein product, partial [marine sediment metagenome]
MARVYAVKKRIQPAHFGLYRTSTGGDESIIVRRKVGEPTDYMHTKSRKLARQRANLTVASQHYSHLTPSQRQIAHRQLYRDALTWRSQLSLANRRYLEGYCIANGVVDSYHIPLPWSRFALKLYLQAVKFVVITKPVAGEAGEEVLFESFDEKGEFRP